MRPAAVHPREWTLSLSRRKTRSGTPRIPKARPPGGAPYGDLRARALVIEVAGVTVAVAGRDDLIAMKRVAGRPIDRGDVIVLTAPERGLGPPEVEATPKH